MNRHFVTRYFATVVALLLASLHCHSSTPLMDSIEYDGQTTIAWPDDKPWFDLPANEKLTELRRTQRCSAIGGPRAKWRLENGRLWLIGLFVCGRDIPLENVFVSPQPILATWITGNLPHIREGCYAEITMAQASTRQQLCCASRMAFYWT